MALDYLRNVRKKVYNHLLAFAGQTVLHGPKYFLNRGAIDGGKEIKRKNKTVNIKMSNFDR